MGKPLSSVRIRDSVGNAGLAVVEDGSVMVVSNWKSRLLTVYALPSGDPIRTFGGRGSGPGQFDQPCKMALTPAGGLLVVENENKRVQEVTLNGEHVRFVGAGVIDTLVLGIALLDGCVVVAKSGYRFLSYGPQILVFDYSTGSLLRSFGPLGSRMGQLGFCEGVRATPDGSHIAVCEFNQARLSILTKGGDFVKCVGVGVLSSPFDVEFAPNGDILVADNSNHRICVFSPDGSTLLRSFSSRMDGSQLRSPTALVMSHAKLWVLDHDSDIVTVYS